MKNVKYPFNLTVEQVYKLAECDFDFNRSLIDMALMNSFESVVPTLDESTRDICSRYEYSQKIAAIEELRAVTVEHPELNANNSNINDIIIDDTRLTLAAAKRMVEDEFKRQGKVPETW